MKPKNKYPSKWREVERGRILNSLSVVPASGPGTCTYAQISYQVMERRQVGVKSWETRSRIEYGSALYLHEHWDLKLAFAVAVPAMAELEAACVKQDATPVSKRGG